MRCAEVELVNMLHVEMEEMEEMVEAATKQKEEVDLITRARELLFEALFEYVAHTPPHAGALRSCKRLCCSRSAVRVWRRLLLLWMQVVRRFERGFVLPLPLLVHSQYVPARAACHNTAQRANMLLRSSSCPRCSRALRFHAAAVQLLFFALAPQPALSWHHEPLMRDNIHVVLLALSFIPRQAVLHGASVFAYPALNLFAVSFAYTLLVVRRARGINGRAA
ncbi:hypothetical protein EON67_06870 [archaeon]|nr:MAG: hypothetical protein EON67_06870 [archaeon]